MLEIDFFPDFLRSDGYAKYQLDVLTEGDIQISDVLCDDTLLFYFMEFLEGEGDRDLIEFWLATSNYRGNKDKEHLKKDALVIYERFISLQSPWSLGVSNDIRTKIEESICSDAGADQTCFDPLLHLVMKIMEVRHLNSFLQSTLFKKYLSELLCQIRTNPFANSSSSSSKKEKKIRRASSNTSLNTVASSEVSITTQNTLLAMSRARSGHITRETSFDNVDPDNLWKRKQYSVVNIGEVDKFGRYRSSYEQLPSNSREGGVGSKFSQVMKRLVKNDITQVQEEMAWKMAEMTIKDVMELTSAKNTS